MFKSAQILAACLALTTTSGMAAENDLFSSIRGSSVYDDGSVPTTSPASEIRITSADLLRDALNSAGFEANVAGQRFVTLSKELGRWTFPVLVTVSEDEQNIAVMLGLRTVKDSSTLTADTLLKMMAASQKNAPFTFSWSAERQRTEMYTVIKNRSVTGQLLRDTINRMAVVAKDNSALWAGTGAGEDKQATEPETVAASSLVGRWSAARSNAEAFAIEFRAEGGFNLVYIKDKNQTKSSGTFAVTAGQLTLNGTDGLKLNGSLELVSADKFKFSPANGGVLEFSRAK